MKEIKEDTKKESKKEQLFNKEALTGCTEFSTKKDLLNALLDDREYTKEEAREAIKKYLNKKVR